MSLHPSFSKSWSGLHIKCYNLKKEGRRVTEILPPFSLLILLFSGLCNRVSLRLFYTWVLQYCVIYFIPQNVLALPVGTLSDKILYPFNVFPLY